MNQSNVIFAFLFAAFVIFITTRGELPAYMGFLLGGSSASGTASADNGSSTIPVADATAGVSAANQRVSENFGKFAKILSLFA